MAFSRIRLLNSGMTGISTNGMKNLFSSSSIQMSKKIEEVVVIGGGLMGAGIAQVRSDMPYFGIIYHRLGFFYVQFSTYALISDFKAYYQKQIICRKMTHLDIYNFSNSFHLCQCVNHSPVQDTL